MNLPLTPLMDSLLQRVPLSAFYPPFAVLYVECLEACLGRGANFFAISGVRSWEEQADLYALGRAKLADGSWIVVDASKVVTNAQAGSSAHQYGIAADSARDKDATRAGLQPSWNLADYQVLAEEAKKLGLDAGYWWTSFRDAPHLQLDLASRGTSLSHLRTLHEQGGLSAVYAHLDQHSWRKP